METDCSTPPEYQHWHTHTNQRRDRTDERCAYDEADQEGDRDCPAEACEDHGARRDAGPGLFDESGEPRPRGCAGNQTFEGWQRSFLWLFENRRLTSLFGRAHIAKSKIETPPGHPRRNPVPRGKAAENRAADDEKNEQGRQHHRTSTMPSNIDVGR